MGVEVCSEIPSLAVSPRISFSHDLKEADLVPVESHHRRSDALLLESIDFNFNFCCSSSSSSSSNQRFQQELLPMSSADELFANGKILPVEVKKITPSLLPCKQRPSREHLESKPISASLRRNFNPPLSASTTTNSSSGSRRTDHQNPSTEETRKKSLKEFLSINSDDAEDEEEEVKKPPSSNNKPFWQQFRRSSSLNFDTCRANNLIRSLHFLSRSNSTGSAPNPKPSSSAALPTKVIQNKQHSNHHHQKEPSSIKRTNSSSLPSCTQYYYSYKSPSLRKNHSNGGHGVRITPVLHIPHACISRNSVLLGFTSLFCNGKSKKKKKSL